MRLYIIFSLVVFSTVVYCDDALSFDKDFASTRQVRIHQTLLCIYLQRKQVSDAIREYEYLCGLTKAEKFLSAYAKYLRSNKMYKEALPHIRSLVDLHPENLEYLNLLGWTLIQAGNVEEGKKVLDEYQERRFREIVVPICKS